MAEWSRGLRQRLRREGFRDRRGFTLVELAIVLVIIGIILGAVLKGQDLILNARAKQFITKVKAWEVAEWTYYDRKGRFAGDGDRNGVIGDDNETTVKDDLTTANFVNPPYEGSGNDTKNTINLGSYSFYVYVGYDNDNDTKNVIVVCKDENCTDTFEAGYITLVEALDMTVDGVADGEKGNLICVNGVESANSSSWTVKVGNANATSCDNATAAVYYFDSRRE